MVISPASIQAWLGTWHCTNLGDTFEVLSRFSLRLFAESLLAVLPAAVDRERVPLVVVVRFVLNVRGDRPNRPTVPMYREHGRDPSRNATGRVLRELGFLSQDLVRVRWRRSIDFWLDHFTARLLPSPLIDVLKELAEQ